MKDDIDTYIQKCWTCRHPIEENHVCIYQTEEQATTALKNSLEVNVWADVSDGLIMDKLDGPVRALEEKVALLEQRIKVLEESN